MIIGSISENLNFEKRVAITPEILKKYINIGFEVNLIKDYGKHLGFFDQEYIDLGVNIFENKKDLLLNSNIIVQLGLPSDDSLTLLKENQTLIGTFDSHENSEKLKSLSKKGTTL